MRWLCLFVVGGLTGCGVTSDYTQLNPPPRAMVAKPVDSVQVFSSTRPTRPYVEVGLVSARAGSTVDNDQGEILRSLRERAAEAGCDAIFDLRANNRTSGGPYGGGTMMGYEATCIVYKDAAPAPAPAPPAPAPAT
jgi:hypothetical protein